MLMRGEPGLSWFAVCVLRRVDLAPGVAPAPESCRVDATQTAHDGEMPSRAAASKLKMRNDIR
jgi:hypothetical protein